MAYDEIDDVRATLIQPPRVDVSSNLSSTAQSDMLP